MNNTDAEKILAIAKIVEATKPEDWVLESMTIQINGSSRQIMNQKLTTSINGVNFKIEEFGEYALRILMEGTYLIQSPTTNLFIERLIKFYKIGEVTPIRELDYCYNRLIPNE